MELSQFQWFINQPEVKLWKHLAFVSVLEWLYSSQQIKLAKRAPDLRNELMQFHEETFYWIYALNLSSFIPKTGDLSPMWFRESYLTMEVAKSNPDPQFGLNESIPWILAEHLLESETGSLIEHCLSEFHLHFSPEVIGRNPCPYSEGSFVC